MYAQQNLAETREARERFQRLWVNNILFVVYNRRETARFNDAADWRVAPGAPLHLAGHLRAEEWRGTVSAGFMVLDAAEP